MVFETSFKTRMAGSNIRSSKDGQLVSAELGFMKNITPSKSIGATFYVSGDDDGSLFGIRYRHRYWFEKEVSLEFSPGIILAGSDNYMTVKSPSVFGSVSINIRDLISLELHAQAIRYSNARLIYNPNTQTLDNYGKSGTQTSFYMGARFGSYAAIFTVFAAYAIGVIISEQTEVVF